MTTKKAYSITIHGRFHKWAVTTYMKPEHAADWAADGIDICELVGSVPTWLPVRLTRVWLFLQRIWVIPVL